jgi:exopolyphosphatase/guanosine-5'-triphosphate,3'-diphosphate pyrophosphatase
LLVCEIEPKTRAYKVLRDTGEITRLGQGLQATNQLQKAAMERTYATISEFVAQAHRLGANHVAAIGTSALRKAVNAADFIRRVKAGLNLDIEVISGETEARYSYLAIRADAELYNQLKGEEKVVPQGQFSLRLVVIDIGGGSTEFILGRGEVEAYLSLNIGAVYLTDRFLRNDPPTADELDTLKAFLDETLSAQANVLTAEAGDSIPTLVGVGGTLVNLVSVKLRLTEHDARRIHGETVSLAAIENQIRLFCAVDLKARMQIPGLEPKRADVIIAGSVILQRILMHIGVERIHVSVRGVRYGAMHEMFVEEKIVPQGQLSLK